MALTVGAPEYGVKYTLTGPDGTIATFNEPLDTNYVGMLSDATGLDSPEVRENAENLSGADGGVHGDFFYGRRPVVLSGEVANHSSATVRQERLTKLQQASNAMRGDATLEWTPAGGEAVSIKVRRAQPLRITGGWVKSFQLALVSADPRIYAITTSSQEFELKPPVNLTVKTNPTGIAASPDGKSVYVIFKSVKELGVYDRSLTTGKLTFKEAFATGLEPWAIMVSADNKDVYFTNRGAATITHYKRNTSTGVLTFDASPATGTEPTGMVLDYTGKRFYVANFGGASISSYTRNTSTGALALKETKALAAATGPIALALPPAEQSPLLVAEYSKNRMKMWKCAAGVISEISGAAAEAAITKPINTFINAVSFGSGSCGGYGETGNGVGREQVRSGEETVGMKENFFLFTGEVSGAGNVIAPQGINGNFAADEAHNVVKNVTALGEHREWAVGTKPYGLCKAVTPGTEFTSVYVTNSTEGTITEFSQYAGEGLSGFLLARAGESSTTCTNKGSMETFPIITITSDEAGTLNAPVITNRTTGQAIVFSGSVSSNQSIVINTKNRTVTLNGVASAYSLLNANSTSWWSLGPGVSEIVASASAAVAIVKVKVEWQSAWI